MREAEGLEPVSGLIASFVEGMIRAAKLELKVESREEEDECRVILKGNDLTLLLAKNAELLNAIEYITQRAFAHRTAAHTRIVFDAGEYRASREAELRLMALKAAEKVKLSRAPFVFDPMSPGERRIIHLALVDDSSVRTESQGDGYNRKVVILPTN